MLKHNEFPHLLKVIAALAADIHEMHTLREHIAAVVTPAYQAAVTEEVLSIYGFEGSGYEDRRAYLDHLHTALGTPHLDIIRDLRRWATTQDPRLDDETYEVNVHGYGHARSMNRVTDLGTRR